MKKITAIALLLCILLGLCACGGAPQKTDEPDAAPQIYDTAPTIDGLAVTVDGKSLSEVYKQEDTYFICLGELLALLDGTVVTDAATEPPYTATITLKGTTYTISNEESTLKEGTSAHPLVFEPLYDGEDWYVALDPIMSLFGLSLSEKDGERHYSSFTLPTAEDVAAGKKIPTLMYHAVSDQMWGIAELFVSPSEMEKQLKYLQDNGYTTITFEDFGRLDEISKPVMLTYDDGYDDNYTQLFPLLKKYNAKATVFVITGEIGKQYYLTEAQIKEMSDSGLVSIQSHTVTHPHLSDLNAEQLEQEMTQSKETLTRITGKEPFVLCYPTGKYSELSLQKTKEHYSFGLLMNGGMYTTGVQDPYMIPRFYISRDTDINAFAGKLN